MTRDYGSFPSAEEADYDDESTPVFHRGRKRSERFHPAHEPHRDKQELELQDDEVNGAIWFLKPTRARFTYHHNAEAVWDDQGSEEQAANRQSSNSDPAPTSSSSSDFEHHWTSRDNRKGRHALVVYQSSDEYNSSHYSTGLSSVFTGIWRMLTRFAFWDITYLTATSFTLAVVILLINAVLSILPYVDPGYTPPNGVIYIEGALTLAGCVFFLFSSFLNFVEAVNTETQGCFGWKLECVHDKDNNKGSKQNSTTRMVPDWNCIHHRNRSSKLFTSSDDSRKQSSDGSSNNRSSRSNGNSDHNGPQWRLFPTRSELRKHLVYDLGFITCTVLLCSSAVYCSAALASFITILKEGQISPWVRIPQIIAGLGFTTSSILFMLETQHTWLVPEFRAIGWQISFWNFLGSIGFTLCAIFALANAHGGDQWSEHQMAYSYLWGSSGFLFGSLLQWYESLDKHPVEYKQRE